MSGKPSPDGGVSTRRLTPWMLSVAGVTFLAGLLFGYDQGVISGALPLLTADLGLSTLQSEVITSWVTLGALVGALVAGSVADRLGRRWAPRSLPACFFTLGAHPRGSWRPTPAFSRSAGSSPASASASPRSSLRSTRPRWHRSGCAAGSSRPTSSRSRSDLHRLPRRRRADRQWALAGDVRSRRHSRCPPHCRLPDRPRVGALAPQGRTA